MDCSDGNQTLLSPQSNKRRRTRQSVNCLRRRKSAKFPRLHYGQACRPHQESVLLRAPFDEAHGCIQQSANFEVFVYVRISMTTFGWPPAPRPITDRVVISIHFPDGHECLAYSMPMVAPRYRASARIADGPRGIGSGCAQSRSLMISIFVSM